MTSLDKRFLSAFSETTFQRTIDFTVFDKLLKVCTCTPFKKVTQHNFDRYQFIYKFVFIISGIIWQPGCLSFHWYLICPDYFTGKCAEKLNWGQCQKLNVAKLHKNFNRLYQFVGYRPISPACLVPRTASHNRCDVIPVCLGRIVIDVWACFLKLHTVLVACLWEKGKSLNNHSHVPSFSNAESRWLW